MLVVFDANVFCADFQMVGNAWRIFMSGFRRVGIEPCIPEIIKDEVGNKFQEELNALAKNAEELMRGASRIVGPKAFDSFPRQHEIQQLCSEYAARLESLIQDHNFALLPYPTVSHKDLVRRALARSRPFKEKGVGYRDAVLWSSILEYLKERRLPIAFVTANSRDFGVGRLHNDLVRDLEAIGLSHEHVKFFRSLEELNHSLIIPTLQELEESRQSLESGAGPLSISDWVAEELPDLLWDDPGIGPFEPGHGSCRLSKVKEVSSVRIDAVRQVAIDQILISATARLHAVVDVSADWDDYQNYPDVREFFQSDDDAPFSSVSAEVPVEITVAFTLILRTQDFSVISSEIDAYETDLGISVEINPHATDA